MQNIQNELFELKIVIKKYERKINELNTTIESKFDSIIKLKNKIITLKEKLKFNNNNDKNRQSFN